MRKTRLLPLFSLVVLLLINLVALTPHGTTINPSINTNNSSSGILLIVLPASIPDDPVLADNVIEALITINKALYSGEVKAYMLVNDEVIEGTTAPKGSIIVTGDTTELEQELKSLGITVVELHALPAVKVLTLNPPKIGILDVGKTYTIHSVLREMGFVYSVVSPTAVDRLLNEGYNVFILPPGSGTYIAKLLGEEGARELAEYVAEGGGLIGICAGAYAVIEGYNNWTALLQLVDAKLKNWPTWWLGTGIVHVEVTNPDNPVVYGFSDGFDAIYYNGPILVPKDLGDNTTLGIDVEPYIELVKYVSTSHEPGAFSYGWGDLDQSYVDNVMAGGSAVTFSHYGKGKIVLFSIHPELTSGDTSYAPNSTLATKYNWRMLFNAIYYVSNSNTITLARALKGAWIWPSTFRYIYEFIRENYPALTKDEAAYYAAELFAYELSSYGITDVFIEVKSTRGYAFYPSNVLPPYPLEPYNNTNLYKPLIVKLHEYGIRVHAWIPCFYDREVWGPKDPVWHVGKSISNWKPYPVTKYVRPANTTYVNILAEFTRELLSMGFDGIHLDYIRYGHMVYSFSPRDIERAEASGINVTKVIDAIRRTFYTDYSGGYDPTYVWRLYINGDPDITKWFSLRRQDIVNAITTIAEAARDQGTIYGTEPILSAALMPDVTINRTIEGYNFTIPGPVFQMLHYGQIYEDFARLGFWLIPMAYYVSYGQNVTWIKTVAEYVVSVTNEYGGTPLIGLQAWSVGYDDIRTEESLAIEGGVLGYVYFRWATYRSTVKGETWSTYSDAYDELYSLIPKVISAVSSLQPNSTISNDLIKYYMIVDAVEAGVLYPNPQEFIPEAYGKVLLVIDNLAPVIAKKITLLRNLITTHDLEEYSSSITLLELLLSRLNTTSDLSQRTLLLEEITDTISILEIKVITAIVDNIAEEITQLKENLTRVSLKTASNEESISSLTTKISQLENELMELKNTNITNIENIIASLNSTLVELKQSLEKQDQDLSRINETFRTDIDTIKDKVSDLEAGSRNTLYLAIGALVLSITALGAMVLAFTKK
ncbi:hypothetical protein J4526_08700 [Desulfurococcaceae archaeon MEX13E-LK6-19]|nr:hypothetical protein J4526_08700 [Desulfurococcaceae archaeon MEX13E-LK6-19]